MSDITTIAKPYARAAYEFAKEHQAVEQWLALLQHLQAVIETPEMMQLINTPAIDKQMIAAVLMKLAGDNLDQHSQNFILVLTKNNRLAAMSAIAERFEALKAKDENKLSIRVSTAVTVSDAQQASIAKALKQKLESQLVLDYVLDESLIGGAVFRIGDKVIDASIKNQLRRLLQQVTGASSVS